MAERADGSIVIDTELDPEGFQAGSARLHSAVRSLARTVEGLGPTFQRALNGNSRAMDTLSAKIMAAEARAGQLKQQLDTLGEMTVPTEEYASLDGELRKLEADFDRMMDKQDKLLALDVSQESQSWKSLQYDIEACGEKIRGLAAKKKELEAGGKAFILGSETTQYARLKEDLDSASASLEKMKEQARGVGGGLAGSAAHVNKTAAAGGRLASHLRKALGYVGRMASGLARMAFHSRGTSQGMQGLLSSIKRLTPALLAAEGVMGLLRKAVSAYMQENQQMANTLNACWSSVGNMLGPIIERLVSLAALASAYFTRFLQLLGFVGKSTSQAISAAGGAAAGAAKKLERQLASFDELNILSDNSGDSGGGGGGIGDLTPELPEVELPDWAKLMAQQIKNGDWGGAGKTLGEALNRFIDDFDWEGWGSRLGGAVQKGLDFALGFLRTTNWVGLGAGAAEFLNGFLASVDPNDVGALLAAKLNVAIKLAYGFVTTFRWPEFGTWLAGVVMGWFEEIDWAMAGQAFSKAVTGLLEAAKRFFEEADWDDIGAKIGEFFGNIDWGGIWSGLWETLGAAREALVGFLNGLHEGLGALLPLVEAIGVAFAAWKIGKGIAGVLEKLFGLFGKKPSSIGGGFQIPSPKSVLKGLADLALIVGGVIALVEVLGALNRIPGFAETAQSGLAALKLVFGGIAEVALPLAGAAAAVIALGKVGVSSVLQGLAGMALILDGIPAVILALGALLSIPGFGDFLSTGVTSLRECFTALGETAQPIAILSAILAGLGFVTPGVILSGLGGLAIVIGGLEAVLVALGALAQIPGFTWIVGEGGKALMQLGEILGGFAGSVVSGFAIGATAGLPQAADNLSQFAENLKPFLAAMKNVDGKLAASASILADAVITLSGASVAESLSSWLTGGSALVKFGQQLAGFAPHFNSYYQQVRGISPDVVTASASAARSLAALASCAPGKGGLLQWFAGEQDMAVFGQQLADFGKCFKQYYNSIQGIDASVVTATSTAAASLTKLARTAPPTGGLMGWLMGQRDLGAFGAQLVSFGQGFSGYADSVRGIDQGVVRASAAAAQSLTELARNVPATGGIFSWFTGSNSIDVFGASLAAFGGYFKQYYDHIAGVSSETITATTSAIGTLLGIAQDAQKADAKGLTEFGQALADFGKKLSGTQWLSVSADFTGCVRDMAAAMDECAASMSASMAELTQTMEDGWEEIGSGASASWKEARKTIGSENDAIRRDTSTKWNAIRTAMDTSLADIQRAAKTGAGQVKSSVQEAWREADSDTARKWGNMGGTVSRNTGSIQNTVGSGFRAARDSIIKNMSEAMRSIGGQNWRVVGEGICGGIYDGLNSNWWWLTQTVADLSYSLLETTKSALGIHSPSVLFKKIIGLNIGYGVGEGIEASRPAVLKAVAGVAGAIAAGFQAREYAIGPVSVDKTGGLPRALDGFSDTVTDSFAELLSRLEAIAQRVTFTMPAVAGAVVPYQAAERGGGSAAETIEASHEELGSVVVQVVSQAAAAIVRAIEENGGRQGGLDKGLLTRIVKDELNRETKTRGKPALLI